MDEDIPLPFDLPAVARKKVSTRGQASRHFGCPRVGCDRISLPRASPRRKIARNTPGIPRMSVKALLESG
jgi:hypothetical protein